MRHRWLTLALAMLSCASLCAANWRIASITANEEAGAFHALVVRQVGHHLTQSTLHYSGWEAERGRQEREWAVWQSWSKAYESLTLPSWGEASSVSTDTFPMEVELTEVTPDQTLLSLAEEGNLSWFCDAYGYDEVLLDETTSVGGRVRCRLSSYVRATDQLTLLVDRLSFREDASDLTSDVVLALLGTHRQDPVSAIVLSGAPPAVAVTVDGVSSQRDAFLVVLPPGRHTIGLSANGYEPRNVEVECLSGQSLDLDATLQQARLASLSAASRQGVVTWFVDGTKQGTASSLTLEDPTLPLLVTAQKDGFATLSHQLTKERGIVDFQLSRDWTRDPNLSRRVQKQFYNAFVSLIFSVGLTLAYPTLYNVYGDGDYLSGGLYVAFQGAAVMSAISLVRSLFTYSVTTMQH